MFSSTLIPVVVILGPTAVGKTEIAIEVAERLGGEIVSADSRLFYRGMDIGTAKPTLEERARIPHHLIDVADPDQIWSLALFQHEARRVIAEINERGRLPILVGGTGQYIRAVIEEWEVPQVAPDPQLRAALEGWVEQITPDGLHSRLAVLDLEAAARIDPRNVRRTIRALEVIFTTGARFSAKRGRGTSPYLVLQIGLIRSREDLYARIDSRIQSMFETGFVDEVRSLLTKGYSPELPTMSAIGYQQVAAYLQGKITLEEAVIFMKRLTRQFVRKQANWFKENDPKIHWLGVNADTVGDVERIILEW